MQPTTDHQQVSRRRVVTGAAWAVPAIVMTTSTPALATSGGSSTLTLTTPNMQTVASGNTVVSITAKDGAGQPVSGGSVSLTGPSGVSFSPAQPTVSGGNATSTMTTTDNWAVPGSTVTISGSLSSGGSKSIGLTVIGANAYATGSNRNPNGSQVGVAGTPSTQNYLTSATQLSMIFPSRIVSLAAGSSNSDPHALALLSDGTVWSIGCNSRGQLGDGSTSDRMTWAKVSGLTGVKRISAGDGTSMALLDSGQVRTWGSNSYGELGDGSTTNRATPVSVVGITSATYLAAGNGVSYAVLADGTVRAWGNNAYNLLGDGTTTSSSTPVQVSGISTATHIATGAGRMTYALLSDRSVRAWGRNYWGQLGNGTTTNSAVPVQVSGISTATQIAAGDGGGFALLTNGSVASWGSNSSGQLGNGATANSSVPVQVSGITTATSITAASGCGFAILSDGSAVGWGNNSNYTLGDGTQTSRRTPISIANAASLKSLASGPGAVTVYFIR